MAKKLLTEILKEALLPEVAFVASLRPQNPDDGNTKTKVGSKNEGVISHRSEINCQYLAIHYVV